MSRDGRHPLPPGWTWTTLGEICRLDTGGPAPQGKEHFQKGGYPFVRVQDLGRLNNQVWIHETKDAITDAAASRLKLFPKGAVLFTKSGMSTLLNQRAILASDMYVVSHIGVAVPESLIPGTYIYYWLKTVDLGALAHATTLPSLPLSKVRDVPVPLAPLPEQHRIVAEIEKHLTRLDDAVASLQRARANLKRYQASVLKAACEGRLVPTEAELARREGRDFEPASQLLGRTLKERRARWGAQERRHGKNREPQPPDTSNLPPVPEGWEWASLSQLSEIQGGIQKQPKRAPKENRYPFLRVANVLRRRLDLNEVHEIELFAGELEKLRLQSGDLLIVEGNGSPAEIGRMAIWTGEIDNCVHQNHIIRARMLGGVVPEYCEAYWNSPDGASRVLRVASSTSGLYTLSVSKVGRLPIPLPLSPSSDGLWRRWSGTYP